VQLQVVEEPIIRGVGADPEPGDLVTVQEPEGTIELRRSALSEVGPPNAVRFTDDALARVTVPALVYAAEKDDLTRVQYHGERLAKTLPRVECVLHPDGDPGSR
jgi:hypothetical protein